MESKPRVISIEDDQGIFKLIQKTLSTLPVDLYHARSGKEALDLMAKIEPDLLVLDIALPDIHGWDVLKQIKQMKGPKPNVVVLTAHSEPTHRFVPAELRQSISTILGL